MNYSSILSTVWESADVCIVFVQDFSLLLICGNCVAIIGEYGFAYTNTIAIV